LRVVVCRCVKPQRLPPVSVARFVSHPPASTTEREHDLCILAAAKSCVKCVVRCLDGGREPARATESQCYSPLSRALAGRRAFATPSVIRCTRPRRGRRTSADAAPISRRFRCSLCCALLWQRALSAVRAHFARGEPYGGVSSLFTGPSVRMAGGMARVCAWLVIRVASTRGRACLLEHGPRENHTNSTD